MAARHRLRQPEETRKKIQVSQIINRLTDHMLGKCEMSATQVRAAEVLLRKRLPDLSAVHNTEDQEQTVHDWLQSLSDPESEGAPD